MDKHSIAKTIGKFGKQRSGTLLYREKEEVGKGMLRMKVYWRKGRVQSGFLLTEL